MTADVFVEFLEGKLEALGVRKVLPARHMIERHARDVLTRELLNRRLEQMRAEVEAEAAGVALPRNFHARIAALLERKPEMPWDLAVAQIARDLVAEA
jgi:hypothetical protein